MEMLTPKEGEIVKCLRDGNLFKVKKVANDFVILDALDGLSQMVTGKRGFDSIFEGTLPSFPLLEPAPGRSLGG
jgi:hypothetical protein